MIYQGPVRKSEDRGGDRSSFPVSHRNRRGRATDGVAEGALDGGEDAAGGDGEGQFDEAFVAVALADALAEGVFFAAGADDGFGETVDVAQLFGEVVEVAMDRERGQEGRIF